MGAAVRSAQARRWAPLLGLVLVLALTTLDAVWPQDRIISATVAVGAFLAALGGTVRQTGVVAAVAVLACALSGWWNDNFGTLDYFVRALVVIAGALFAVEAARARERLATDRRRFRLLSAAATIGDRAETVETAIDRVRELVVPALGDECTIELEPEAVAAAPAEAGTAGERSLSVALRARGMDLGTLRLAMTRSGRRFSETDAEFARVLAGRVALALDNAGLFSAVESLEARQTAALGSLDEAVTIQDAEGRLIYVNDAAARSLGFGSRDELLATAPQDIVDAYDSVTGDGRPLRLEDLPGRRVLAGETPAPLLVRAIHRESGLERWRVIKATAVRDRDGRPRMAVNVIEDVTDVKRAEVSQRFLAEAGRLLSSSLDHQQTLQQVASLAVPQLADWCSVSMPDEHGVLRAVAVAHSDPEKVELAHEYDRRYAARVSDAEGSAQVLRDGVSQLVNELPDELLRDAIDDPEQLAILREIGMRAVMMVPMVATRRVIGVVTFVSAESRRRFSQGELELAEELGRRAGTAVENARLYTERSHIARTLQMSLLPDALPDIPGFEIASLYRPAGEENVVGGDFYDAFETPAGWMVIVGDVTGRGAEAAALTAQARHTLRTAGTLLGDPAAAVGVLNHALSTRRDLPICTVAVVLLDVRGDRATAHVVCAGHPIPLLVRTGAVRAAGRPGPMVGAWTDATWQATAVELEPGDVLLVHTDGVTDAAGRSDRFGEARLAEAVRDADGAAAAITAVRDALQGFERGAQADDTALVAVERLA